METFICQYVGIFMKKNGILCVFIEIHQSTCMSHLCKIFQRNQIESINQYARYMLSPTHI